MKSKWNLKGKTTVKVQSSARKCVLRKFTCTETAEARGSYLVEKLEKKIRPDLVGS